jgi:hypothetical protein
VADRTVFQVAKTELENKIHLGHKRKRSQDTNLDCTDCVCLALDAHGTDYNQHCDSHSVANVEVTPAYQRQHLRVMLRLHQKNFSSAFPATDQ